MDMLNVKYMEFLFIGLYTDISEEDDGFGLVAEQLHNRDERDLKRARVLFGCGHEEIMMYSDLHCPQSYLGRPDAIRNGEFNNQNAV